MKYFLITTLVTLSPSIHTEISAVLVVLKHSTGYGNKAYVDKISTPRKPVNRTTSLTSLDIYFRPDVSLDAPIYAHIAYYKKFATQYKPFMIKLKVEVCEVLKLKSHPVFNIVADKTNGSNIMDPCPMKGHRFVKRHYTSYDQMPPLIPIGLWRTDFKLMIEVNGTEVEALRWTDYYEVTPKGIVEF